MGTLRTKLRPPARGMGLIEVMVGIVISMLLVLVIYQIYEVSESQKRTITAGSDAQQNASYGMYMLTRDLSMAGNGIASVDPQVQTRLLQSCASLRPIPVLITAGSSTKDPDSIEVLYGGSSSLATDVQFKNTASTSDNYVVASPVGFNPQDYIAAVQGANCTVSRINAAGVTVDPGTGFATLAHTRVSGASGVTYTATVASLVNLGKKETMGRIVYTVDADTHALRSQKVFPDDDPVTPVVSDVVNLKAQYGLDANNDGIIETWQPATGTFAAGSLPTQPLATIQQIRAVRVALVTRSAQYERDLVSPASIDMFGGTVTMTLEDDDRHYRYKVLETVVPLRNALWNFGP